MPASERSSSQKRAFDSARSRITSSVHLPQTMSAVRQTGQSEFGIAPEFYRKASLTEVSGDLALLRAPHDGQLQLGAPVERVEEVVEAAYLPPAGGDDEVTGLDPRRGGGAAVLHAPHEQAVALGQPDRGAQLAGGPRWSERHAELGPDGRLAARERLHARMQRGVGRQREDQPAVHADGVDAEQMPVAVGERAAGG